MGAPTFVAGLCPWALAAGVAGLVACEASPPARDTADTRGQQAPDAQAQLATEAPQAEPTQPVECPTESTAAPPAAVPGTSTGPATAEAMHADLVDAGPVLGSMPAPQVTAQVRAEAGASDFRASDAGTTSPVASETVQLDSSVAVDAGPSCDVDACNDRGQCVELVQWAKCECLPEALPDCPPPPRFREIGPSRTNTELILYLISGDGLTVAGNTLPVGSSGAPVGVTWTWQGGLMVLAQDPLGPTFPMGISFDGQVLSGYIDLAEGEDPPVVWRQGQLERAPDGELPMEVQGPGTAVAVPEIEGFGVTAASADGQIVFGTVGDVTPIAAIWTEKDGVRAVRDVLVEAGIDMSRWSLSRVNGCSADGKTFFGLGSTGFYSARWIVDLP